MLLRTRSNLVQTLILVLIAVVRSQNYDPEYQGVNEESDDHSEYTGEGEQVHPDYSKYYSVDGGAPQGALIQGRSDNGFVSPIEFSTFFGTPNFAFDSSNKHEVLKPLEPIRDATQNGFVTDKDFKGSFSEYDTDGFGTQDFFEQAQKQKAQDEQEDEAEPIPGPSYISHRLPVKNHVKSDVENFRGKPKTNYQDESDSEERLKDFKPSPLASSSQFQPSTSDLSKALLSEEELTNLPYVGEFYKKYSQPDQKLTPYQKYSFQPSNSNSGLKPLASNSYPRTPTPFNPSHSKSSNYDYQPSEVVQKNVRSKECIKINKQVSDTNSKLNKQPMQCFVCNDPKSGAKYERCSYSNEPSPKSYFKSTSHSHGNPDNFRNKRDESESYANPYEEVKSKSQGYNSQPEDFEKDFYKAPQFEEFNYGPEAEDDKAEAEDKSYSEIQSQSLAKSGDKCRKATKNGVTCTVCTDPKTGGNYEQCSYESEPNEKQYAYVSEKKFDGDGNPVEEREEGSTEPKPVVSNESAQEGDEVENYEEEPENKSTEEDEESGKKNSKIIDDSPYDVPSHFEEDTYKQKQTKGLDPELYGSASSSEDDSSKDERGPQKFSSFDDYHLKLFPQLANQESRQKESRAEPNAEYFDDHSSKKDVEKVLEEFSRKDRSNCKQIHKKGMTCYLCVDKHGIQQEECMYVSESKPQSSHIAYHEVQVKPNANNASQAEESQIKPVQAESENKKRKVFFKKATTSAPVGKAKNSERGKFDVTTSRFRSYEREELTTVSPSTPKYKYVVKRDVEAASRSEKKDRKRSQNKPNKAKKVKKVQEPDPKPQFDIKDEDGLYTAETQPVYSKRLGLTLPKYMLERSPLEEDFDRSVANLN